MSAPGPERGWAIRLYSRILGEEVWLTEDSPDELIADLRRECDHHPVFTIAEVLMLKDMAESDTREILRALAKIRRALPGLVVRSAGPWSGDACRWASTASRS